MNKDQDKKNMDKEEKDLAKQESTATKKKDDKQPKGNRNKRLKHAAVWSSVILVAILLLVNIFLSQAVGNRWEFDWTSNKVASVQDTTKDILAKNDKEITITVLANKDKYGSDYTSADLSFIPHLLDEYERYGKDLVTVRYIDPVDNPAVIEEMDPNNVHNLKSNQIVVSNKDFSKLKVLTYKDLVNLDQQQYYVYVTGYTAEEAITGAIRFVASEDTPVVYVTTGHGEADVDKEYSLLRAILEQNNFLVKELNTTTSTEIPEDAKLLIMLAPNNDISKNEVDLYTSYLKTGGSLLTLLDYSTVSYNNLNKVLELFDLKISDDRVKENSTDYAFQDDPYTFVATIKDNPLYPNIEQNKVVATNARAITKANSAEDWISTSSILETTEEATRDLKGDANNPSLAGKLNIAMYSENKGFIDKVDVTEPAKVAVFGSATMFKDQYLYTYMNSSANYLLAYSSISELANLEANQANDLLIKPKPVVNYSILPKNQNSTQVASAILTIVYPVVLLIIALVVYRKRKNL